MVEVFEGHRIDWNKFTAKDAAKYVEEAQKHIQEKEYIDIIKEIAYVATSGQSSIVFSKKLTGYTISKLIDNGFNVVTEQNLYHTLVNGGPSIESNYWTTTIKW